MLRGNFRARITSFPSRLEARQSSSYRPFRLDFLARTFYRPRAANRRRRINGNSALLPGELLNALNKSSAFGLEVIQFLSTRVDFTFRESPHVAHGSRERFSNLLIADLRALG